MIFAAVLIDNKTERELFIKIYYEYRSMMYRIAYNVLNDTGLSEDCVQESLIQIAININKIDTLYSPRTRRYIITITKNKAIDIYRSHHKTMAHELYFDEIALLTDDIETLQISNESSLSIAILELPVQYRDIILLKYVAGFSVKEIAEMLSITSAAVRKRISRGKKILSESLANA